MSDVRGTDELKRFEARRAERRPLFRKQAVDAIRWLERVVYQGDAVVVPQEILSSVLEELLVLGKPVALAAERGDDWRACAKRRAQVVICGWRWRDTKGQTCQPGDGTPLPVEDLLKRSREPSVEIAAWARRGPPYSGHVDKLFGPRKYDWSLRCR